MEPPDWRTWTSHDDLMISPIKKDRLPEAPELLPLLQPPPRQASSLPGFISQRTKQQRLSCAAFTNQMYSAPTDLTFLTCGRRGHWLPPEPGKAPTPSGPPSTLTTGGSSTLSKKRPPPPPPGHKRTLSDPPSPLSHSPHSKGGLTGGSDSTPPPVSKMSPVSNKFEGIPQQQSTTSSNTKSHTWSKASHLPPKPQLGDLPPKPQLKDLPLLHLADILEPGRSNRPRPPETPRRGLKRNLRLRLKLSLPTQPPASKTRHHLISKQQEATLPTQPAEDTNGTPAGTVVDEFVPAPRKINTYVTRRLLKLIDS
ncbi:arf-GAP with SH3 domain, ANK repeat and PH domain-containing protein 1 isoform X3 [Lates japonicus]|uniref:Arf-GAP with SH3 domain, ANK repeat and PH domain-containing protein 1 isoform X3 n=1 Tax=Lates japonicus TaxID=270547 RepID=A0AAD3MIW5_LATJO|nr:arf-GAP with SH3 domain, ANK repeat and PH domain-containing protein 1 isoform X3 [Lates japonicus]